MNASISPAPRPAHAAEHDRLADNLCNMRRCPIWGLPEEMQADLSQAVARLDAAAGQPDACPLGWDLLLQVSPILHAELAAYEACAALQRLEGVDEGEPWTRQRCHEALSAWRALTAYRHRAALSSYRDAAPHYAPPTPATLFLASSGLGLRLP